MMAKKTPSADWLQAAVIDRTRELGLSGAELARRSGVSQQHVSDYLACRKSMGSHKLQHVFRALGLSVRAG